MGEGAAMTAGEHLVALSGLGAVTAGQHLLAIIAGGGVSQTIYASQFTVRIDTPDITVATLAKRLARPAERSSVTPKTSEKKKLAPAVFTQTPCGVVHAEQEQTVVRTGDKSQIVTFKPTRHEINH